MEHITQLKRLGLFEAKVPRYTSYPPATQFRSPFEEGLFRTWVSQIESGSRLSLYVHIPFCRRLCWFCACRTQGVKTDGPITQYLKTLYAEIALLKSQLPNTIEIGRVHWGGGTPTLLNPEQIRALAGALKELAPWADDVEFSVEIDPTECDAERISTLAQCGMNRASIGIQDFNLDVQQTIGRLQSYEQTRDVVDMLRASGIASINADILYGLPHQDTTKITQTVQKVLALSPDRIALYGYAHVPWMAKRQCMIQTDTLPTPEERIDLFETAKRLFNWDGFDSIGIDHFAQAHDSLAQAAKKGALRRNFQGYTDDTCDTLIGLGASSISRFKEGYAQNASATMAYTKAIQEGHFATHRGYEFTQDDKLYSRLIEALMCDFRVDIQQEAANLSIDPKRIQNTLYKMAQKFENLISLDEDTCEILPQGRPLTRMMARALDQYEMKETSHSSAT